MDDLLVVGAGLAGLSTAIEYLESGGTARVTVVESMRRPNELHPGRPGAGHCSGSGGLGLAMLRQIGWKLPDEVIMARIKRATLRGPTESFTIDGALIGMPGEDLGVVNSKHKFGDWLLDRAIKLGADYRPGFRVNGIANHGGGKHCVMTSLAEVDAGKETKENHAVGDFIVGADGPNSGLAEYFFQAPAYAPEDYFLASEVYLNTPSHPKDLITLDFQPSVLSGYRWLFPASKNGDGLTKVGLGFTATRKQNPSKMLDEYRKKQASETGDQGYLGKPIRYIGGKISGSMPLPVVCDPKRRAAVVGEAGRMVMASIGAGDSMAIESGRALGASLARGRPEEYQPYYEKHLRSYLRRHFRIKQALLGLNDKEIDRAIRLLHGYKPKSTNTREEVTRLMRHILWHDPFLLGRAAIKALL